MKFHIKYYKDGVDKNQWNKVVEESPTAWLYHTADWIDVAVFYEQKYENRSESLNASIPIYTKKGELLAGLPLFFYLNGPSLYGYAGPFYNKKLTENKKEKITEMIYNIVDNLCVNNSLKFCKFRYTMLADDYINKKVTHNPLLKYGYFYNLDDIFRLQAENYLLRVVNLAKPLDVLYSELGQKCRN